MTQVLPLYSHQGAVSGKHLDYYLNEYTFRFNRRTSRSQGVLFYRLEPLAKPPRYLEESYAANRLKKASLDFNDTTFTQAEMAARRVAQENQNASEDQSIIPDFMSEYSGASINLR